MMKSIEIVTVQFLNDVDENPLHPFTGNALRLPRHSRCILQGELF